MAGPSGNQPRLACRVLSSLKSLSLSIPRPEALHGVRTLPARTTVGLGVRGSLLVRVCVHICVRECGVVSRVSRADTEQPVRLY